MLTCKRARMLIVRTIDAGILSAEARASLRHHLVWCAPCREEYEAQYEVRRLLALQVECKLPARFTERLNARLAQEPDRPAAQQELGRPASTTPLGNWELAPARDRDTRWRTRALCMVAAAATLALIVAAAQLHDLARAFFSSSLAPSVASSSDVAPSTAAELPSPPLREVPRRRRNLEPAPTDSPARALKAPADRSGDSHEDSTKAETLGDMAVTSPAELPSMPELPVELIAVTPRLAPELAKELRLSDTQRHRIEEIYDTRQRALREILQSTRQRVELERSQTDAAIERVLTPDQRQQYRERCASLGSSVLMRPAAPLSSGQAAVPPQIPSATCRE
jgi:hypothetical protein